jgi:hypothetical protein
LGGYHKKVLDEMTIGGVPPFFHRPWFINPELTLSGRLSERIWGLDQQVLGRPHHEVIEVTVLNDGD